MPGPYAMAPQINEVKKLPPSAETMRLTTVLKTVPPTNPATFDSFKTAPFEWRCVPITLYLAVPGASRH
jgi:hypothetical protein